MVKLGSFQSGAGKPTVSGSLEKPVEDTCSSVPPTEPVRPGHLHSDALIQLPDPTTGGEGRSQVS